MSSATRPFTAHTIECGIGYSNLVPISLPPGELAHMLEIVSAYAENARAGLDRHEGDSDLDPAGQLAATLADKLAALLAQAAG